MAASITQARAHVRLHVLPPVRPVELLPIDFRQTAQLIEAATDSTQQWLDHGPHDVPNLTSEVSRVFPTGRSAPS
jgi:NTE family protein